MEMRLELRKLDVLFLSGALVFLAGCSMISKEPSFHEVFSSADHAIQTKKELQHSFSPLVINIALFALVFFLVLIVLYFWEKRKINAILRK